MAASGSLQASHQVQRAEFGRLVNAGEFTPAFSHSDANQRFVAACIDEVLPRFAGRDRISVIDCGCGTGAWMEFLADRIGDGTGIAVDLFGFDLTPEMVAVAHQRWQGRERQPHLAEGNILDEHSYAQFRPTGGGFDIVFAYDVVQQLPRRQQWTAVETLLRHVAPGGVMMVFDHDCWSRYGIKMALKKAVTWYLRIPLVPRYYCNARYPPLNVFVAKMKRQSVGAQRQAANSTPKCAFIVDAPLGNG
ncbi:MAG: class I SAM-dependent methyltransferase [Rhodospirillales bacterium]|nr:MAG: class I SAM-dependent methyltransferase [Rhodospirillales bacterium]